MDGKQVLMEASRFKNREKVKIFLLSVMKSQSLRLFMEKKGLWHLSVSQVQNSEELHHYLINCAIMI